MVGIPPMEMVIRGMVYDIAIPTLNIDASCNNVGDFEWVNVGYLRIYAMNMMLHGAGIFSYKTG